MQGQKTDQHVALVHGSTGPQTRLTCLYLKFYGEMQVLFFFYHREVIVELQPLFGKLSVSVLTWVLGQTSKSST